MGIIGRRGLELDWWCLSRVDLMVVCMVWILGLECFSSGFPIWVVLGEMVNAIVVPIWVVLGEMVNAIVTILGLECWPLSRICTDRMTHGARRRRRRLSEWVVLPPIIRRRRGGGRIIRRCHDWVLVWRRTMLQVSIPYKRKAKEKQMNEWKKERKRKKEVGIWMNEWKKERKKGGFWEIIESFENRGKVLEEFRKIRTLREGISNLG